MYATGDFFRLLPDGTLGVIGRRDGQVKIRGNRVELTEVESAIREMEGIENVSVQAVSNGAGKELCAYIVGDAGAESVREWVSGRKPAYMVPAFIVKLDSIPLNINGKVDKKALPVPDISSLRNEYAAPRNETERKLCEAFEEILGTERVGIDDDFIRLGGDSLKAIRIQNMVGGVKTADILRYRTPKLISEHSSREETPCLYSLESGCPLTESQLNVYLDMETNSKTEAYVIQFRKELPAGADGTAILNKIMDIHPVLRGYIVEKDGVPWMKFDGRPVITSDRPAPVDIRSCVSSFSVNGNVIEGNISHAAFDGFSLVVLGNDIDRIIAGEIPLSDTGILQMSSFDSVMKNSGRMEEGRNYFESMLCDNDNSAGLIPGFGDTAGKIVKNLTVPPHIVKEKSKELGTSVGNLMTSVFAYTLSRFTGYSKSSFCFIDNGRSIPGLDRSIGMFVKTIPVCIDCSDRPVCDFISSVTEKVYDCTRYGFVPFRELSSKYGINIDVLYQHLPVIIEQSESGTGNTISDFNAVTYETADGFGLDIEHSSAFSGAFIKRFADTFDLILNGIVSAGKLSDIAITDRSETELEEKLFSRMPLKYRNIVEKFCIQANSVPDNTLLKFRDSRYSYGDVDKITSGIASGIAEIIKNAKMIAVLVPRSEWYLLCALGAMKTGAAYVPLDDAYPDERLGYMIENSGADAVLAVTETFGRAEKFGKPVIDCRKIAGGGFVVPEIDPLSPAVILYTSGTTGKPKGSVITHRAVENMCEWYVGYTGMNENDVYSLYTSYSFDIHTLGIFAPLYCGASVDIVPEEVRLDMKKLNDHFVAAGATHTFITTQVGKLFASMDMESGIRFLLYGGEKLGEFTAPEHLGACESYGPSENLALSAAIPVNERTHSSSVGKLLPNMKAYILDAEKRRVPYGAVGELHLSGYQLSLGYLNNEKLNSEVFLKNPFSSEPGYERMYATGDFFRLLPDGTLGVIGRRDGQVKIRGNRVELTEVESAIREMEGIENVTVQAVSNGAGKELCAYIVGDADAESVKEWVSGRKPAYMVPAFIVKLDSIPLNINGKVDKKALPVPD
ncbi:MAG: AMP-binding protein, partial [Candidatus Methanomethylophilaceae archaeon]|nr:AMP-binding protein [Candidatus Methanomethylophilaceae archaeon]